MNANELRVGNIVHNNVEWLRISAKDIYTLSTDATGYFNCEGVSLTEEWLIKFGLKKGQVAEEFTEWGDENMWVLYLHDVGKFHYYCSPEGYYIEYVHQFQNLAFAVTGKELICTK